MYCFPCWEDIFLEIHVRISFYILCHVNEIEKKNC